jgi:hypothetical protein
VTDDLEARLAPGRMKTYRGEDRARLTCPAPPLDGTLKGAQEYVDRITRSAWWKRTCRPSLLGQVERHGLNSEVPQSIMVQEGRRGRATASYSSIEYRTKWFPQITLGVKQGDDLDWVDGWTRAIEDPYVVLHEVAHIMAYCHGESGHGRAFRWYMVGLVRRWLGPDHARALTQGYEAEGLKWRKSKT